MASAHQQKVVWHKETLPPATQKALDWVAQEKWLKDSQWYLAGGTALALQMGHRTSVDLDFFTPQKKFKEQLLVNYFPSDVWSADGVEEGTVYGTLCGAKISFIAYPFFVPARPVHWYGNVRVLDARDIAVMKIIAVSQRGRKRDFYDLYWYIRHREPLLDVVLRLPKQYPDVAHNYHHILKALTYFADAEHDPEPRLNFKASWRQVKSFLKDETASVIKKVIHLK